MSKLDDKFVAAIEELKECFVVAQAMAKNSFKISEANAELEVENKKLREILTREVDDGRAEVDDIGVDAWIEQALKGK